jgi:hypothetical protein
MDHLEGGATILISGDVQSENIHWHRTAVNGIIDDYDAIMVRGTRAHQRTETIVAHTKRLVLKKQTRDADVPGSIDCRLLLRCPHQFDGDGNDWA